MPHIFSPVGPASRHIADLGWFVLVTFAGVSVVMWALVLWVTVRRTGSLAEHAPWDADGGQAWIVIGGVAIPVVILLTILVMGLRVMAGNPLDGRGGMHEHITAGPEIRIIGHQWWWEVEYLSTDAGQQVLTANEIHIPAGRPVDIELLSRDVIHSFWVPQLHGKVDLIPGLANRIRIDADRPGVYPGECSEFCGVQHAHMLLLMSADTPSDYATWLTMQRSPASVPVTARAQTGQQVFMTRQCVLCHTIRGTSAHGQIGPDLTHLGGRRAIAANVFWNSAGNLAAWVTHAQSLKPGAGMPNITSMNGEESLALVEYLQQLH
jgi:cytochrome c oxidase subunit II